MFFDCPVNKEHLTDVRCVKATIDLFGGEGDTLGDFVPLCNHGFHVISDNFAERLKASKLTGFEIRPGIKLGVNQSEAKKVALFGLEIVGSGGPCRRFVVK